jgi:hypothetical protein
VHKDVLPEVFIIIRLPRYKSRAAGGSRPGPGGLFAGLERVGVGLTVSTLWPCTHSSLSRSCPSAYRGNILRLRQCAYHYGFDVSSRALIST